MFHAEIHMTYIRSTTCSSSKTGSRSEGWLSTNEPFKVRRRASRDMQHANHEQTNLKNLSEDFKEAVDKTRSIYMFRSNATRRFPILLCTLMCFSKTNLHAGLGLDRLAFLHFGGVNDGSCCSCFYTGFGTFAEKHFRFFLSNFGRSWVGSKIFMKWVWFDSSKC